MACMLRLYGNNLDLDDLRKVGLSPESTWKKGEPRIPQKPRGKKFENSGARYLVSNADFSEFEKQIVDAINFLKKNGRMIRKLMKTTSIDEAFLDFGVSGLHWMSGIPQFNHFPPGLIMLAGNLGLGIELSHYPVDENE